MPASSVAEAVPSGFWETLLSWAATAEKLYLKGNGGSHAIIELFGEDADNNGTADQIEDLRAQNILINDATISFFIARSDLNGASEAKRIYLYDATNQTPIIDYTADSSTGTTYNVKSVFGGVLILNSDEEGVYYTIRISQHLNRVLNGTNSATNKNVKCLGGYQSVPYLWLMPYCIGESIKHHAKLRPPRLTAK